MACNQRHKHRRDDQDGSKFRKCENLCLRDQTKRFEKVLFSATNDAAIDGIAHRFFYPAITRNDFCFHIRKMIS